MALLGSSKGVSKKDINFFEEYTAAARRTARYLAYFIFAALVVIAIFVIWWFIAFLQNNAIKKDITAMQDRIASDEFKDVEVLAAQYEADLAKKNEQLYAISSMRNTIDTTLVANPAILDLLIENIPSDAYVDSYTLNGNQFTITGFAFTDYSAVNLVAMLQDEANVFNTKVPTKINLNRVDDVSVLNPDGTYDYINCYYSFTITGNLTTRVNVSISSYANVNGQVVALGGIQNNQYEFGDDFENKDFTTITYNGVNYSLTSIQVDGSEVSGEVLSEINATGTHVIKNLTQNVEVTYYYAVAVESTEGGEA